MYVKKSKKKKKGKTTADGDWHIHTSQQRAVCSPSNDLTMTVLWCLLKVIAWLDPKLHKPREAFVCIFLLLFFPRAVLKGATCIDHNQEKIWGCTGKNVTLFVLQMHHNATPSPIMCLPSPSSAPSPCRRERPGAEGMSSYTCECSLPDSLILYLTEVCADDNLWPWPWLQGISRPSVQATD